MDRNNKTVAEILTENETLRRENEALSRSIEMLEQKIVNDRTMPRRFVSAENGVKTSVIQKPAPFTEELKEINIPEAVSLDLDRVKEYRNNWIVYAPEVSNGEMLPGLIVFLEKEFERIMGYMGDYCEILREASMDQRRPLVILSPLKKIKTYSKPFSKEDLEKLLEKYEHNGVYALPTEKVRDTLEGESFSEIIGGEYCGAGYRPIIYLYYRVFDASDTYNYLAGIRKTFAHELLHFAHHMISKDMFFEESTYAERVREALADFFSIVYCIKGCAHSVNRRMYDATIKCARNRYDLWIKRFNTIWPYGYALYFLYGERGIADFGQLQEDGLFGEWRGKFTDVLDESRSDNKEAYRILTYKVARTDVLADRRSERAIMNMGQKKQGYLDTTVSHLIVMKESVARNKSYEEAEKILSPEENINRKEDLSPIYIERILMKNRGHHFSTNDILKMLQDNPYRLEMRENAVRRILKTLAMNEEFIWATQEGHNFEFWYSEEEPEGNYINYDTMDDFYDDIE